MIVDGEPTDPDDKNDAVDGFYRIDIKPDTDPSLFDEVALEIFHNNVGISTLDDFNIYVVNSNGQAFADQNNDFNVREDHDLESMGDFSGKHLESDLPFAFNSRPGI